MTSGSNIRFFCSYRYICLLYGLIVHDIVTMLIHRLKLPFTTRKPPLAHSPLFMLLLSCSFASETNQEYKRRFYPVIFLLIYGVIIMTRLHTLVSALRGLAVAALFIIGFVSANSQAKAGPGFPTMRLIPAPGPCCFYVQYNMFAGAATWTSIGCVPTPPAVITGATSVGGYVNTPPPAPVWRPTPGIYFAPTGGAWVTIGTICVNPNGVNPFCVTFYLQGVNGQWIPQIVCTSCDNPIGGNPAINSNTIDVVESDKVNSDNAQIEEMSGSETSITTDLYPNPAQSESMMTVTLSSASSVTITLSDVTGRIVSTLADGKTFNAGVHNFNINSTDYSAGAYYVTVRSGNYTNTIQLNIVK